MIQLDVCRILLVEDNPGDAFLVQERLEEVHPGGYEMVVATSLRQTRQLLVDDSFDVILLDLSLPDSQGLGTFQAIHSLAPLTPIIILSGMRNEEVTRVAMDLGAQEFLLKDGENYQVLSQAIHCSLGKKRLSDGLQTRAWTDAEPNWWIPAAESVQDPAPHQVSLRSTLDLTKVMEQVAQAFSRVIAQHGGEIVWDRLPAVEGNPIRLTEILQNLVIDAVTDQECQRPRLQVEANRADGQWLIRLRRTESGPDHGTIRNAGEPVWFHWPRCVEQAQSLGGSLSRCRIGLSEVVVDWHLGLE